METLNNSVVGLVEKGELRPIDIGRSFYREDEPITSEQRRKLHDLVFNQFEDYSSINHCLQHIETLTREEADEYIESFEY